MADSIDSIIAGRTFKSVDSGGGATKLEVGDRFVGTFLSVTEVPSKFDRDKNQKRYDFLKPSGDRTSIYGKGNLNYLMGAVPVNALVLIERLPDEKMDNGFTSSTWAVSVAE